MKMAILGGTGRLGGALARELAEAGHEVMAPGREVLDLAEEASIRGALGALDFEVLINPAALTSVDYCETHEAEAEAVNARAPGVLAEVAAAKGARFIHVSTDYVFDGETAGALTEGTAANPINVYGRTKRAGEEAVLAVDEGFLVARTSWVFGPDRAAFVDELLGRAMAESRVEAIDDKDSALTYSVDFAQWLDALLDDDEGRFSGLLHLCNAGGCTWREYGQVALELGEELGLPLRTTEVAPIRLEDLEGFVARRPRHTVMATEKFTAWTGIEPRPWQEALAAYLDDYFVPRWRESGGGDS